jgi:SNF2 family DNA or RNA helicase
MELRFVNTISQICHKEPPPELYGGIIADPMGLGKTLTMIALVAMDIDNAGKESALADDDAEDASKRCVGTTLIIVPPSRRLPFSRRN